MAFQPVRLTDPKGVHDDVVAEHPVDYNNFRFRDGYVEAKDQSGLEGSDDKATNEVASDKETEPAKKESTAAEKRAAAREAQQGKATDAAGNTVQTA